MDIPDYNEINERLRLQEEITKIEGIAKRYMTREAIIRYGNVKAAYPELALSVMAMIANAINSGQINAKIDDNTFKSILGKVQEGNRSRSIRRV